MARRGLTGGARRGRLLLWWSVMKYIGGVVLAMDRFVSSRGSLRRTSALRMAAPSGPTDRSHLERFEQVDRWAGSDGSSKDGHRRYRAEAWHARGGRGSGSAGTVGAGTTRTGVPIIRLFEGTMDV